MVHSLLSSFYALILLFYYFSHFNQTRPLIQLSRVSFSQSTDACKWPQNCILTLIDRFKYKMRQPIPQTLRVVVYIIHIIYYIVIKKKCYHS